MHRNSIAVVIAVALCAQWAAAQAPTLKVGDPAPALAPGKWIKGEPVKQFEKGTRYVVEFWATWCGPCVVTIPHLSELQAQHKDIIFIGQNCWEDDQSAVAPFVQKMGERMNYRVAMDDVSQNPRGRMAETWMAAAGQDGIPTAFVVDKDTTIAWIGHPMELGDVLKQIVAGTFDAKKVAALREARDALMLKLRDAVQSGGPQQGLKVLDDAAKENPELARDLAPIRFRLLIMARQFPAANAMAKELAAAHNDEAQMLNQISWIMVDPRVGFEKPDLELAEKMAMRANELTKGEDASILDTVARVLFLKGDVDKAIEYQTRAVEKTDDAEMKRELQKTLDEYRAKKTPR